MNHYKFEAIIIIFINLILDLQMDFFKISYYYGPDMIWTRLDTDQILTNFKYYATILVQGLRELSMV